jgi:hypothetical protein
MPEYKMSSVGSSYAQKSARSGLFIVISGGDGIQFTGAAPVIPDSVIAKSTFDAYSTADVTLNAGDILKDLGREIVVYDDAAIGTYSDLPLASPHRRVYREVAVLTGSTNEGLNGATNVFVQVFSAYGSGVVVARLG